MARPDGRPVLEDWSLDPAVLHLNHGSFGAVPRGAAARQQRLREEAERDPDAWFRELPPRIARARREVARLLGAPEHATALVSNATSGVAAVLRSLDVPAGGRIVVTDHAYGGVDIAVRRLATRRAAEVVTVHVPLDADGPAVAALLRQAVDERTALVVLDQITSATARLMPVREVAADCRERGVPLLVDGAHAPGMLAEPLAGLAGACWVGNLHKWPCAPRGTAALVADTEHRRLLHPPVDSWGSQEDYPLRFDHQGTRDLTGWLAAPHAHAAIEERYGWDAVRAHMSALAEYGQRCVAERWGVSVDGLCPEPAPAMRLVPLPTGVATDQDAARALQRTLAERHASAVGVSTWRGRGFLRLSAHVYNTPADYEAFADRCARLFS